MRLEGLESRVEKNMLHMTFGMTKKCVQRMRSRETAGRFCPNHAKRQPATYGKPPLTLPLEPKQKLKPPCPGKGTVCPCANLRAFWDWIEIWNIVKQLNDNVRFIARGTGHLHKPQSSTTASRLFGHLPWYFSEGSADSGRILRGPFWLIGSTLLEETTS